MNNSKAVWYLTGIGDRPTGPYHETKIAAEIRSGKHSEATLCWREGMDGWQPLDDFEPFATEFRKRRSARRRRAMLIAAVIGLVACLAGGGVAAYFVLVEPAQIRAGRRLIEQGSYGTAVAVLKPYVQRKQMNNTARYLLAIARINQFATGDTSGGGEGAETLSGLLKKSMSGSTKELKRDLRNMLDAGPGWKGVGQLDVAAIEEAKRDLKRLLDSKPKWKETARRDVAAAAGRVRSGDMDAPMRTLEIARLRAELDLAAQAELAGELLALVTPPGKEGDHPILQHTEVVLQICDWDASFGKQLVELAVGAGSGSEREFLTALEALGQWVAERPTLAREVVPQVLRAAGSDSELRAVLEALGRWVAEHPALAGEVVSQLWSKVMSLYDAGRLAEAKAVLSKILDIDPQGPATREQILLCIRLLDPGKQRFEWCRSFWAKYPNDAAVAEVLLIIVKDAVVIFDGVGVFGRSRSRTYVDAGLSAATSLLAEWPKTDTLDVHVYELLTRLAEDGWREEVLALIEPLLAVAKDPALREQIEALRCNCDPNRARQLTAVRDAIACFDRARTWEGLAGQTCMKEGLSAANELLDECPGVAGLDVLVYDLARRLIQDERCPEGLDLTRRLLAGIPNSTLKGQIEVSLAQWERTCIVRITDAGILQETLAGGFKGKVLWVALTKKEVGTETIKKLREWTLAGGVLWVETDLAEAFGLGDVTRTPLAGPHVDTLVANVVHPIVNGLRGMSVGCEVSASGGEIVGSHRDIYSNDPRDLLPLLVVEPGQGQRPLTVVHVFCGGRPCNRGIAVFRPAKIDTTSYAGRRFEENLRSFCLEIADQSNP